jgi:DNA-binding GntR family transcriptional regulator
MDVRRQAPERLKGADAVAAAIRADIGAGQFTHGAWLKQIDLEQRYACSRADVRRALEKLETKGIVQRIPERGYYVTNMDTERHRELVEVRVVLEVATVPGIVERATPGDLSELRRLAELFAVASRQGDAAEKYNANRAFHVYLTQLCPNRELANLTLEIRGNLPSTPIAQWKSQERIEKSVREHFEMVDALEKRKAALLTELITRHIRQPEEP